MKYDTACRKVTVTKCMPEDHEGMNAGSKSESLHDVMAYTFSNVSRLPRQRDDFTLVHSCCYVSTPIQTDLSASPTVTNTSPSTRSLNAQLSSRAFALLCCLRLALLCHRMAMDASVGPRPDRYMTTSGSRTVAYTYMRVGV